MRVSIRARGIECDKELRGYVNRRVAFALSRFADSVRSVEVQLEDVNNARGGVDRRCMFLVNVKRESESIVCETTHADIQSAIDLACGRAGRTVARALDHRIARRPLR